MVKVSYLVVCLKAENSNENGLCAYNILSTITPPYIPGAFSFSIALSFLDIDPSQTHIIRIQILDQAETSIVDANLEVPLQNMKPEDIAGLNMAIDFNNIVFQREGNYKIAVLVDGEEVKTKEIPVKAAMTNV